MLSLKYYTTLASLFSLINTVAASDITSYADGSCQKSHNNLNVVNGYPDGVCTPLLISKTSAPQSFQIAKLDPECAVTIYGPNEGPDPCSSSLKIVAEMGTCYNSTWIYYSVDNCMSPKLTASASGSTPATTLSTSSLPSSSASSPPTTSPSSPSSSTSSPSTSPSSSSPPPDTSTPPGAVIGGITGGVAGVAVALGAFFFYLRRRRQRDAHQRMKPLPPTPRYELSNDSALMEAQSISAPYKVHLDPTSPPPVEIGRNSVFEMRMQKQAALARDERGWNDDKHDRDGREVQGWNMI